jgi:WbqC-like protein family
VQRSMTSVAIHQPNYLPWPGFFAKAAQADVLVLYDTVQFEKRGYTNRVQIKANDGAPRWLTQPVISKGRYYQRVREVQFAEPDWWEEHSKTLRSNYKRAPYFDRYFAELEERLQSCGPDMTSCNESLIAWACKHLELPVRLRRASALPVESDDPTERLIRLVQAVGGDTYISGAGGFKYQDLEEFDRAGIQVLARRSAAPSYPQLWGDFVPGLSIVDLLFNCGPASAAYVRDMMADQAG